MSKSTFLDGFTGPSGRGDVGRGLTLNPTGGVGVRGVRNSQEDAFTGVYAAHHDFVRRTVRALGVEDAAADDVTQEVFMVVFRRLPEFDHAAPVKAWVFGIARNLARKHATRRSPLVTSQPPSLRLVADSDRASPDLRLQRRDAAATVQRFLDSLDEDKRAVFVLAELEGLSAPEVRETLGVKLSTVYSRLRLARA
ncbi:MAG: sigma-70 family RNA polymerase sigma factor, partial [Nannocystaceae bacterium]|nr:sigma-70 family RNA polymerase sigma factor [Nannocystaceae bacterium]